LRQTELLINIQFHSYKQGHAVHKTLLQHNPSVLNWGARLHWLSCIMLQNSCYCR